MWISRKRHEEIIKIISDEVKSLRTRIWKLENPPKYEVGFQTDEILIAEIELKNHYKGLESANEWDYHLLDKIHGGLFWVREEYIRDYELRQEQINQIKKQTIKNKKK
jgi:hypothetical protein